MIIVHHTEPQFIVTRDLTLQTEKGTYYIDAGQPLGLLRTEDGRLFIGESSSDQLELSKQGASYTLLESCRPCNFEVTLNEDGDSYISEVLLESKVTLTEKINRISLTESVAKKTVQVTAVITESENNNEA